MSYWRLTDIAIDDMKKTVWIFGGVFLYGFAVQYWAFGPSITPDKVMWTNQIEYFLNNDQRAFDFYKAYGHPGGTLVALGSLFHLLFGVSYSVALKLSMSLLIATASALCAVFCTRLSRHSLWWLTASFILIFNRLHLWSTPPTSVVMPLVVLVVLMTWWLCKGPDNGSAWASFFWGVLIGVSAATRLDVTALVGGVLFCLLVYRNGVYWVLPSLAGVAVGFIVMDPFLWFMPFQHLVDLFRKFTIHYDTFAHPRSIKYYEWPHTLFFALPAILYALVFWKQGRLKNVIPVAVFAAYLAVCLVAAASILTSSYQAPRYLYPLIVFWEVFLPLLAFETFSPAVNCVNSSCCEEKNIRSFVIIGVIITLQMTTYVL